MRILHIRGANLASLAGEFSINLGDGPLKEAGIFAISGPTGAGKSTILDAICLALYDRTPRLSDQGGVEIGEGNDRLKVQDVKNLLRKGTSRGFAEVTFVGVDEKVYRARWEVKRARNRIDGKIQDQEITLFATDDSPLAGGKKRETLQAIEAKLGLSFDEFRQSALLAQGDFAAFLKADSKHRAALLERITGTRIYAALSTKAHERAKKERLALEDLEKQVGQITLLSDEERLGVTTRRQETLEQLAVVEQSLGQIQKTREWIKQNSALVEKEQAARSALEKLDLQYEQWGIERANLSKWQKAIELQPLFEKVDEARRRFDDRKTAHDRVERDLGAVVTELETAKQHQAQHKLLLEENEQRELQMQGELDRATQLDASLEAAALRITEARENHAKLLEQVSTTQRVLSEAIEAKKLAERQLEESSTWLDSHPTEREFAAEYTRWRDHFSRLVEAKQTLSQLPLEQAQADLTKARENQHKGQRVQQKLEHEVQQLQACEQTAQKDHDSFVALGLRSQRDLLTAQERALRTLDEAHLRVVQASKKATEIREQLTQSEREQRRADETQIAANERLTQQLAEQSALESELEIQRARFELAPHRQALREGDPCPVCGSLDHSAKQSVTVEEHLYSQLQKRVKQAATTTLELERELARAQAQLAERKKVTAERRSTLEQSLREQEQAKAHFVEVAQSIAAAPRDPFAENTTDWIETHSNTIAADLDELRAKEEAADKALATLVEARKKLDEKKSERDIVNERLASAVAKVDRLQAQLNELERDATRLGASILTDKNALASALRWISNVEDELDRDPLALSVQVETIAKQVQAHSTNLERFTLQHTRLEAQEQSQQTSLQTLTASLATATLALEQSEAIKKTLEQTRSTMLGGQPVALVREQLRSATTQSRQQHQTSTTHVDSLERKTAALRSVAGQLLADIEASENQSRVDEEALQIALNAVELEREQARGLIGAPRDYYLKIKDQLTQLEQQRDTARAVLEERIAQNTDFSATKPDLADTDLDSAEQHWRSEQQHWHQERVNSEVALRKDDEARSRLGSVKEQLLRQQQQAELWGALDLLIGSADGSKFSRFAQGLTLSALVFHANEHLSEFARRYRLETVPGTDLDLQVIDRDMGDEVRSVASLSGGESFLVSLGLALALSTLGSKGTRVDTLFIDEGFGTLDLSTLDTAIAALSALQSEGRQIGLISHIPGLAERLGAQVMVKPKGAGRSIVCTEG